MSIKARALERHKTIPLAQRTRVGADALDDPARVAADQPRLAKFCHLF
jgi:hypothetical protein